MTRERKKRGWKGGGREGEGVRKYLSERCRLLAMILVVLPIFLQLGGRLSGESRLLELVLDRRPNLFTRQRWRALVEQRGVLLHNGQQMHPLLLIELILLPVGLRQIARHFFSLPPSRQFWSLELLSIDVYYRPNNSNVITPVKFYSREIWGGKFSSFPPIVPVSTLKWHSRKIEGERKSVRSFRERLSTAETILAEVRSVLFFFPQDKNGSMRFAALFSRRVLQSLVVLHRFLFVRGNKGRSFFYSPSSIPMVSFSPIPRLEQTNRSINDSF